ncbi:uncharacterized protein LOC125897350 [Epinephelus fuscoguttatus]|uniref:uncharacterized protein LOC125897350 n=1 Tax=Epinephelus fuscoguttatus TaxID=293821 RepID=UPI0020D13657|nr:uncharacterized protein LOC125897350 [Epinephelus fuscoguttatus]
MNRHATDVQELAQDSVPSPPLPADHVLNSAAVLFPGAFDQQGCPLIVFPADEQAKLSSELSKAEVVDFIKYFLCLHNKKQEKESLVSVVADLRHASLPTTRFIAETLLLLELHKRTVHSVYIIQPKKKENIKLLLKLLAPSKSYTVSFKKVLLKEISELSNYIDRSQLTASLGGYFIYCHQSWVAFVKEIDEFVKEFLCVVQRLPSCISTLQALSRLPLPSTFAELQHFCSTNEAKFQQLRRELGLDELQRHCESVMQKLRYPEQEPCYQAMAGTALFTHTAFDMLQNYSRITAAVEKVELLWQQAFSKARLQLRMFQLREDALQITEQIKTLLQEKLQPYKIEIAKDADKAVKLVSEFETSIYTPAMALVHCAEDVIHTVAEILLFDGQTRERWVLDVERLKEKLSSAVHFILQTLRAVSNYHHYYNKASSWYSLVLCENVLQVLLSGVNGDSGSTQRQRRHWGSIPAWRYKMSTFLKKNPPPDMEELVYLAHLSNAIPDDDIKKAGKQMSQRCMTLRKLLMSSRPVAVSDLQLALQWQYDLLRSSRVNKSSADGTTDRTKRKDVQDLTKCESSKEAVHLLRTPPLTTASGMVSAEGKPSSLSSFDSGFDGAGSSQLEACGGREGVEGLSRLAGTRDFARPAMSQPQIHTENLSSVSDSEDHREEFDLGSVGNSSRASIQIIPKVTVDSLNLEIKVKRSAALPSNPWLSLPVDDLENSYTVTITPNPTQQRDLQFHDPSDPHTNANQASRSRDQPTQTEVLISTQPREPQNRDWTLQSQSSLEDPELSPIRNILSSTITETGGDKSMCTTQGIPTLLWDSYDLHDQNRDAVDGVIDLSLNDWDVKEQEDLREVEKILDRTDEILEREENVLAQEAVLEALLRSEKRRNQWPLWDSEDQLGAMSSSELAEAGVLGFEDYLNPAESDNLSEPGSTGSASEIKASEDDRHCSEDATGADTLAFYSRPDLLQELKKVHVLDELIMEENLKIHEFRSRKENLKEELSVSNPADTNGLSSVNKDREAFRLQLEKEKKEVEKLEKSLDKDSKVKKPKDRASKVIKCSIMEWATSENKEDQALCDELLSGSYNRSQRTHSPSLVQNDSQAQDTYKTENVEAVLGPDVAKETTTQDLVQLPHSKCLDHCSAAEPSVYIGATLDSISVLKELPEESVIQPQGCINGKILDKSGENASLTSETRPDDGVFDPGGESHLLPVPKPRRALLLVSTQLTEHEPPHSTKLQKPAGSSVTQDQGFVQFDLQDKPIDALPENVTPAISHNLVPSPNVKEHSYNNKDNHALTEECKVSLDQLSEISTKDEEDASAVPECLLQVDSHPTEEVNSLTEISSKDENQVAQDEVFVQFDLQEKQLDEPPENVTPAISHDLVLNPNVKEHSNNNNNNYALAEKCKVSLDQLCEITNKDEDDQVAQDQGFMQFDLQDKSLDALPENVTPAISHDLVLNPNVKEHSNNNNNNYALAEKCKVSLDQLSEMSTEDEEDTSAAPECLLQTDSQSSEEDQTSSPADVLPHQPSAPQLHPDQPVEFDPSGRDEQSEDFADGVQSSEAMRVSGSGSPGIQTHLNISTRKMTDYNTPIVLDTGSGLMKAGFADQDLPSVTFPTIIGMPKYEEIMNGSVDRETYIGHEAQHMRGVLALKHPIKNGIIRNWDEMEKIWHHTFQQLRVEPDDHPVMLTEAAMNPLENRQRMVEIMFECFNVPFTYVAMQAVLALYAAGRSTGVVFDSGDGVSHSVPVFEGYCLPHAVQRFPLAGLDVTMHLKKLLQEQGVSMRTSAEMEIVREIKEKCCCVALNYEAELSQGGPSCREMYYTMPDGQIVTLTTERFRAPEILFKPELIGRDHYGMHESIFKSILSSDIDLRRCFLGNIVLSGGNTLLAGLPERLQAEIRGLVPTDMAESVRVSSPKDRVFSVWSGGAVLANLPSFSSAWISQEEYEEYGPLIVFRKCF